MLRCEDCEYFERESSGEPHLTCSPFTTIKEPECLMKWQLIQLRTMAESHQATLDLHRRFAPLQEKMFRHMEREIDEAEDADQWKLGSDEDDDDVKDDDDHPTFRF